MEHTQVFPLSQDLLKNDVLDEVLDSAQPGFQTSISMSAQHIQREPSTMILNICSILRLDPSALISYCIVEQSSLIHHIPILPDLELGGTGSHKFP